MDIVGRKPCREKMAVVQQGVFDAETGYLLGNPRVPYPLGAPQAPGPGAETRLEILAHVLNLVMGVGLGNHRYDRLEESSSHELYLGAVHQGVQEREKLGLVLIEPLPERSGIVQRHGDVGIFRQDAQKRQIAVPGALFKDTGEIPHRLVRVNAERQIDLFRHAT